MDYYQILGLPKKKASTNTDIKKAYFKLAKEWHPDKHPEATKQLAEQRFQEISEAHAVLSDPKKRKIYDQLGHEGLKEHESMSNNPSSPFGGPGSPFGSFFSTFGADSGRIPSIKHTEQVPLEDFYTGTLLSFKVLIQHKCHFCEGSGCGQANQIKTCSTCRGSGQVMQRMRAPGTPMIIQQVSPCPKCKTKGKFFDPKYNCTKCTGKGRVSIPTPMEYVIQPGMDYGSRMIREKGDYLEQGGRGNLILNLVPPNNQASPYQRKGPHLIYEVTISLVEALFGFDLRIPYPDPDAPSIRLTSKKPVPPNTVKILKGKGMPLPADPNHPFPPNTPTSGDFVIVFKVKFPEELKPEAIQHRQVISQALSLSKPIIRIEPKPTQSQSQSTQSTQSQSTQSNSNAIQIPIKVDDLPTLDEVDDDDNDIIHPTEFAEFISSAEGGPPECTTQ